MSSFAAVFLCLASLLVLAEGATLVKRVVTANTDFSVFHRTARELVAGAGPELYATRDAPTGFYHCIPPAGMLVFLPMAALPPATAAALWAVTNLALLAVGVWQLRVVLGGLDRQRRVAQATWPWAAGVLLLLSAGSLQVGQFSSLFAVCWIVYLAASYRRRDGVAAVMLAIPAAVKLYPLLLGVVPLTLRWRRQLVWLVVALFAIVIAIPAAVYGPRLRPLSLSFIDNTLLSPQGRVASTLDPAVTSSQGLDLQLLRYLTSNPTLQAKAPWLPHADWPRDAVLAASQALRLLILAVSGWVSWRWARRRALSDQPRYTALMLMGLWSAALCLVLPETKARYSAYMHLAFLPLLMATAAARLRGQHARYVGRFAVTTLCLALCIQFVPDAVRAVGAPLAGILAVWAFNLRHMVRGTRLSDRAKTWGSLHA